MYAILALIPLTTALVGLAAAAVLSIGAWGLDFAVYWDAFHRWAAGGPYYQPWQLAGAYLIHSGTSDFAVLMPPTMLLVSAPFALLPRTIAGWLWVFVPVAVIGWSIHRLRPPSWSWPILALLVAWPWTGILIATGSPTIALTALLAVALATRRPWLAAFVLLKPSLSPFALVGVRSRYWWLALAGLAVVSLPLGSLWLDWLRAIGNASDGGLLYSLPHVPTMALPVVAWWAANRPGRRAGPG